MSHNQNFIDLLWSGTPRFTVKISLLGFVIN